MDWEFRLSISGPSMHLKTSFHLKIKKNIGTMKYRLDALHIMNPDAGVPNALLRRAPNQVPVDPSSSVVQNSLADLPIIQSVFIALPKDKHGNVINFDNQRRLLVGCSLLEMNSYNYLLSCPQEEKERIFARRTSAQKEHLEEVVTQWPCGLLVIEGPRFWQN